MKRLIPTVKPLFATVKPLIDTIKPSIAKRKALTVAHKALIGTIKSLIHTLELLVGTLKPLIATVKLPTVFSTMLQEKIPYRTDWRKLSLSGFCLCMQASKTCSAILVAFSLLCIA